MTEYNFLKPNPKLDLDWNNITKVGDSHMNIILSFEEFMQVLGAYLRQVCHLSFIASPHSPRDLMG